MKYKLYYIDNFTIPSKVAHSLQIENNIKALRNNFEVTLISYSVNNQKLNLCNHIILKRPKLLNKIIPLSTIHLIFKIRKNYFEKDSILFTRNSLIALIYHKKFKKVLLEIHDIPTFKDNFLNYFLFKIPLEKIPLFFLKKINNLKIITISKGLKIDLIKKGFDKNKIIVLPDGVDLDKFNIEDKKLKYRKELNLPLNKKIIMYTGTLQEWKGCDTLIKASLNLPKNIQLVIIGTTKEQKETFSRKYPNIIFKEFVEQNKIPKYLKSADILIIPNSARFKISTHYTSPLKLFEYMTSKRPIIASNIQSIKEIVSNKEVLFFEPDNYKDLEKKIIKLINNKKLQHELSKNSFKKVKNFTWEKRAKQIFNIIKN